MIPERPRFYRPKDVTRIYTWSHSKFGPQGGCWTQV
jgi:hypothetical protein